MNSHKKVFNLRQDLSVLELSSSEKNQATEKDLSTQSFNFILSSKEITKKHAETNGSLMRHTKAQLVDIILRKDNIEKELREQLKDAKDNYQRELNKAVNKYRHEVLVRENLEKDYFNLKDNYYTVYDEKATEKIILKRSRNRWKFLSWILLTLFIVEIIYVIL